MSILELVHILLEDKLNREYSDTIDIRFTREQAKELYETIHRRLMLDKNAQWKVVMGELSKSYICNGCGAYSEYAYDYCPYCGKRMTLGE